MSLGLKRGTVQLEPHDKQWDEAAIQTIKNLKAILGDDVVDIQHIGSTAIPAIKAKPIIDIAVGVTDFEKIMSYNEQLQKQRSREYSILCTHVLLGLYRREV